MISDSIVAVTVSHVAGKLKVIIIKYRMLMEFKLLTFSQFFLVLAVSF